MHEVKAHAVLIDCQQKMEAVIANIECNTDLDEVSKREQIEEVRESQMSAGDKIVMEKFKKTQQLFWAAEIELYRVLFILQQLQKFQIFSARARMNMKKKRVQRQ